MPHEDHEVVDQIAHFAEEVFAPRVVWLVGCFHDLGRFFDYLGADLHNAASQKLGRVRLFAGVLGTSGDRALEVINRAGRVRHGRGDFPAAKGTATIGKTPV